METKLSVLYQVLNIYKESLVGILNKIDQSILQAAREFDKQQTPINGKYKLMEEMSFLLETYIHTLNTFEHTAHNIVTKYRHFENAAKPFEPSDNFRGFCPIKPENISQQQTSVAQIKNELNLTSEFEKFVCSGSTEPTFRNDPSLNIDKKEDLTNSIFDNISCNSTETLVNDRSQTDENFKDPTNSISDNISCTSTETQVNDRPQTRSHSDENLKDHANSISDNISCTSTEKLVSEKPQTPSHSDENLKRKVVYTVPEELSDSFSDDFSSTSTEIPESRSLKTSTKNAYNSRPFETPASTSAKIVLQDICSDSARDGGFSLVTDNERLNVELNKTRKISANKETHNENEKSPKSCQQSAETHTKKAELTVSPKETVKKSETIPIASKIESSSGGKMEEKPNKLSAVMKLLNMRKYDRKEEERKKFERPGAIKEVKWKAVSPMKTPPKPGPPPKEKHQTLEIPGNELEVDQICAFTHVISPSEFYVRTDQFDLEFEHALNEYMNKHHHFVVNHCQDKAEARDEIGNFCCTFLPNKTTWFRVEIIDWMMEEEPNNVFVQLIDYGHRFYWDFKNLKPMPEVYSAIPKMANRCHLAAICSPNLKFQQNWPQHSIRFFESLTHMKKFICIHAEKEEDCYAVDFCELDDPDEVSLRDVFLKNGHGFDEHSLDEEFKYILKEIEGSEANTSGEISEIVSYSSEIDTSLADTSDVLTRKDVKARLNLPQVGDSIRLFITGYVNVCHFYAHILSNTDGIYNKDFKKMKDRMKMNNSVQSYETFETNPQISELVLVKEGLEWARGSCEGFTEDQGIEVFLLDFGYKRIKKLKDLRKMKEEFLEVPFQAIECVLYNCQEKERAAVGSSRDFFDNCMHRQTFNCVVMKSSEPLQVQMFDSHNLDMCDVLDQYDLIEDRNLD